MPTLFMRLQKFCAKRNRPLLSHTQRRELGERIKDVYFKEGTKPHCLIQQNEPEGTFTVISYPKTYNPTIDQLISEFYASIPAPPPREKPKRKRTPLAHPIPVFSTTSIKK